MRKQFLIPTIAGVTKDLHARAIPEHRCQDALNVLFEEGRVRTRWGYRQISANLPLSGPVTLLVEFDQIITGEKFFVVCTTKDVYYWDMSRGIFIPFTPVVTGSMTAGYDETEQAIVIETFPSLDMATYPLTGVYIVSIIWRGITAHENNVSHVNASGDIVLDDTFFWFPFSISRAPSVCDYDCIETEEFWPLVSSTSLGIFGNDPYDNYTPFILRFIGTPIGLVDGTDYIGIQVYQGGAGSILCPFSITTPISFTGTFSETTRTITSVVTATPIPVGSIIRISSITLGGSARVNFLGQSFIHFIMVTSYNPDTGIIEYARISNYGSVAVNYFYNLCNGSPEGAVDINLNVIHQVIDLQNPLLDSTDTVYLSSIACLMRTEDVSPPSTFSMRICSGGTIDDYSDSAIIYDDELEDKVLAITNGIDNVKVWDGAGSLENLGERTFSGTISSTVNPTIITSCTGLGPLRKYMLLSGSGIATGAYIVNINITAGTVEMSAAAIGNGVRSVLAYSRPNKARYIDYFGSVGMEHVITANTNDSGINNVQTIELSDAGEIDLWTGIFYDLIDTNDPIVGVKKLQSQLAIYKERSIALAIPIPQGGNQDPFEIIQNRVSTGTPSGRTVVDFDDFHIFFGWDNVYIFNGIGVQAIGSDIMNDLNAGINRPFMSRSFAFAIRNKNLYCLFVPYGMDVENCNRAYIYNYREQHWTIWQLSHEMSAYGSYHQSYAPSWADLLLPPYRIDRTGTLVSTENEITVADTSGIEVFNVVEGTGIPANTNVLSISGTTILISNAATASGAQSLHFFKSWRNMNMRWEDLILYEDNERYVLGDIDGNIFEISDRHFADDNTAFNAFFITKDFALSGNPKQNFKLVETVIGICDDAVDHVHSFGISASIDFGVNWTDEIVVAINEGSGYVEQIVNWLERGRQVRFRIRNTNGSYFKIESLNIGFNDSGVLKTNYN